MSSIKARKSSSILRKEKDDIAEYWRELLRNSLLTGVPQIVSAKSVRSKVFKTVVFLGSILGFLYQTSAFLVIYFGYPTLVDVQVTTPPFVDLPSITICNRNGIKRSVYCKMKPENCAPLKKLVHMCENHPEMCKDGNKLAITMYPLPEYMLDEATATQEMVQQAGHTSYPLISKCTFSGINASLDLCKRESFRSFIFEDIYGRLKLCYILNAKWSQAILNLPQVPVRAELHIVVDLEPEEYFSMNREVGAQVAVHSPWSILNPFTEGFSLRPKKVYLMHLKETIKNLLPWPYLTNCTDYIKQWQIRGGNGPLSKENISSAVITGVLYFTRKWDIYFQIIFFRLRHNYLCIEECLLNQTMDNCNCALTTSLYPHHFNFCSADSDACTDMVNFTRCYVKCSPACHSRHFEVEINEEDIDAAGVQKSQDIGLFEEQTITSKGDATKWNRTAEMRILFKRSTVNTYTYRAKYEGIELYSFLGGYVGIWLGMSLIAVLDFMESLGTFTVYVFQRMKESTKLSAMKSAVTHRSRENSLYLDSSSAWALPQRHK